MTRGLTLSLAVVIALLSFSLSASAARPEGQAVTYANFMYVNYVATSQAKVYFATTNGIIVYNKMDQQWESPLTGAEGLPVTDVKRLTVDRFDERLFAETVAGVYEYNFTFERWLPAGEIPKLDSDDKHINAPNVLFPPFGFNYIGNGNMVDAAGRQFALSDIVDDGAGNLWIGTWGYGPATASSTANMVSLLPYGLLQDAAYTLLDEDSVLWTAGPVLNSQRSGITGFNRAKNSFVYIESGTQADFPEADVYCLEGTKKYLCAGTSDGLYLIDRKTMHVARHVGGRHGFSDNNILSLKAYGPDTLFIGTDDGLLVYCPSTDSIGYISQSQFVNKTIYSMAVTDSFLWIASNIGAYRLSLSSGKLQRYQDPDNILFTRVFDVRQYDHYMWLTSDNGLVRVDLTTGDTEPYRISAGKLNNRALAINDKLAVVAAQAGVTFIFLDKGTLQTRDFTTDDGLASNYVYSLVFNGDYLWIGTDHGLTRFLWNNPHRVD